MNRQLQFEGTIAEVQGVKPVRKGFIQVVHVCEPHENDSRYDQFFTIQIYSNKQTDSRFLPPAAKGQPRKCICYFKGQRWTRSDSTGWQYNNKLELINWIE